MCCRGGDPNKYTKLPTKEMEIVNKVNKPKNSNLKICSNCKSSTVVSICPVCGNNLKK